MKRPLLILSSLALMASSAFAALPEGYDIITAEPAGEKVFYERASYCFVPYGDYNLFGHQTSTTHIIYGDDGYAYLYNPFTGVGTYSYLKCEVEGNRLTATLPQAVFDDSYAGNEIYYFATNLYKTIDDNGNVKYLPTMTDEIQTVSWIIEGDTVTMETDYVVENEQEMTWPDHILAMVDQNNDWIGYGDATQTYFRLHFSPVEPPADLEWEEWVMVAASEGQLISVGFDGDDVYLADFSTRLPDAVIKGTVEGDKVVFLPGQYVGNYPPYFVYFMTGTCDPMGYYLSDDLVLSFDPETREMKAEEGTCMLFSISTEEAKSIEIFEAPTICPNDMDRTPQPCHPVPTAYVDSFEAAGYTYVTFYLPNVNPYNAILDTSGMYYEVSIDGDAPMVFQPDEYFCDEPMTRIPYNFNNGRNIISTPSGVGNLIFFYFFGYETVSIRLYNEVGGETYKSPLMVYYVNEKRYEVVDDTPDAVESVASDEVPVATEHFDLHGRRLQAPASGLTIERQLLPDGSVRVAKRLLR